MKFPVSVYFGNTDLPVHGIIEFLAFFISFRYFIYLRKKQQDPIPYETPFKIEAMNFETALLLTLLFVCITGTLSPKEIPGYFGMFTFFLGLF